MTRNHFEPVVSSWIVSYLFFSVILMSVESAQPFDFTPYQECTEGTSLPLPRVAPQFTIKAERKSMNSNGNETWGCDAVESYYDSRGQRGMYLMDHGNGLRPEFMWDLKTAQAFYISENKTCSQIDNIAQSACSLPFATFLADLHASAGRAFPVKDVSDRCNLTVTRVTFLRFDTVRSIPVRVFRQCAYDGNQNTVTVKYYYAAKGLRTTGLPWDRPVRFESRILSLNDNVVRQPESVIFLADGSLGTIDVTHYSETIDDFGVFLPPTGSFCPTWSKTKKALPPLRSQFVLSMKVTSLAAKEVHKMTIFADRLNEQVQFYTHSVNGTRFPPSVDRDFMDGYVTLHDYRSGLQFVISFPDFFSTTYRKRDKVNCTITPIDREAIDSHWVDEANSRAIHVENANQLFGMNNDGRWIYLGERDYNGVGCYVWSRQQAASTDQLIRITEVYWLKEEWSATNTTSFYGMIRYRKNLNGTLIETYKTVVTEYSIPFSYFYRPLNTYVGACFRTAGSRPLFLAMTIKVRNYTAVSQSESAFLVGLRQAFSDLLETSTLRMSDMEIEQVKNDTKNQAVLSMTFLDWVNITSKDGSREEKPSQQIVDNLRRILSDFDHDVSVQYNSQKGPVTEAVTILKDSLRSGTEAFNSSSSTKSALSSAASDTLEAEKVLNSGYTGGDMTGLAFAMLIIFGSAGFAGGYFHHKLPNPFRR